MSRFVLVLTCLIASLPTFSQSLPDEEQAYLEQVYVHLHQHPELSLQEEETAAYLMEALDKMELSYTYPMGAHNIAGLLENGPGPVILLRTDMDALPMDEQTGVPYASKEGGAMHACGHDLHMTVWLGVLRHLHRHREDWSGSILFVAQSAEEIGQGAQLMIDHGLFEQYPQPDYILAYHDHADIPAHTIGLRPGWAMASVDMFTVRVRGIGGHGAMPHETIDPVVLAAKMVVNLQTLVSRELSPVQSGVVTVGAIHGGTVGNIIPNEVVLKGTVRSFAKESRELLLSGIERTCRGIAIAAGVPDSLLPLVTIEPTNVPAMYNDPDLTARIQEVLTTFLGADQVAEVPMETIGEDFSLYSRELGEVPSCMLRLGTYTPGEKEANRPGLHSPFFAPDYARAIPVGVLSMVAVIRDLAQP